MKAKLIAVLILGGFAANAAAYGSAGCGLGSMVFQENNEMQILAATTNGTFGSQTFGMTFGTSNCNNKGLVKLSMQRQSYIEANFKDLSREVASGKGEFVKNLASLYNVPQQKLENFSNLLQRNHNTIFAANNAQVAVNEIDRLAASL